MKSKDLFDTTSSEDLPPELESLFNQIDAFFYSSDILFDEKALNRARFWVARWEEMAIPYCQEEIDERSTKEDS